MNPTDDVHPPVKAATAQSYFLGEGPLWDAARHRLLWVDIYAGHVLTGALREDGTIEETHRLALPGPTGAVALDEAGDLLVATAHGVSTIDADGSLSELTRILGPGHPGRLNDGKVDPRGRFVVGSLSSGSESSSEVLVLVDGDAVTVIDDDLTLSNGLAWSVDGSTFYSVDTMRGVVFRRAWGEDGPAGVRESFITIDDGHPDGITVDAEDHVWVAIWGGGRIERYSPDGTRVASIPIPAPHVSSVAFAGDDLRTLVVTTARENLTEDQLAAFPDSGRLFTLDPGVAGVPQTPWVGPRAQERMS